MTAGDSSAAGTPDRPRLGWRAGLPASLLGATWARCCIAAGFVAAHLLAGSVRLPDGRLHLREGLLTWDGTYYRVLVDGGYASAPSDAARFFPLYPAVTRLLAPIVGGRTDVALVLVANVAAVAAALVLWTLVTEALGDTGVAERSAWMLALWPAAFVLAFAYSEALFVLTVAAALLLLHRRRFLTAGMVGAAAAVIRPVGVLLIVPALIEVIGSWRHSNTDDDHRGPPRVIGSVAAVLGPPIGTLTAFWWIAAASNQPWSTPLAVQRTLRGGFREPVSRLIGAAVDVAGGNFRDLPNLLAALLGVALVVVAVRRRQPWSWVAYSVVTLVVALAANNIDSLGRYLLAAVPLIVAAAQWADRPRRAQLAAVVGSLGVVAATTAALLGRVVP
ncbi:MAG: glycosyltransferase family 39 protein [Actinomycetes bacterium]